MAQQRHLAVLVVRHLRKSGSINPLHAGSGNPRVKAYLEEDLDGLTDELFHGAPISPTPNAPGRRTDHFPNLPLRPHDGEDPKSPPA